MWTNLLKGNLSSWTDERPVVWTYGANDLINRHLYFSREGITKGG